ncbi:signal peptidase 22 kDa subunit [Xylariaceae sp. FL0804]|nr:signal peptidase 22 kDa subunit [Xylariaceae sp. FL0804]
MYNSLTRIQNVFGFFTTVAFVVAAIIAASDFAAPRTPSGTIKTTNVQVVKGRPHYYSTKKEEYAIIKFSLDADLSSLFTWNTKQLFVYVTAEWPAAGAGADDDNGKNQTNSAVIWDSIITSPSADHLANLGPATLKKLRRSAAGKTVDPSRGKLSLKNQKPKYQITHPSGRVARPDAGDDVVLRLHYNVQPWVGLLTWDLPRGGGGNWGRWRPVDGGESDAFALPALKEKGKKKAAT